MKKGFTRDFGKKFKIPSRMDLMKTRWSIWKFVSSIQYLNIILDEERSSSTQENSGNTELFVLWAPFKQVCIDKTDSWTKELYTNNA